MFVVGYELVAKDAMTVLCVDDDPTLLIAISRQIRKFGYEVLSVTSAAEARGLLETVPIDVVVSDLELGTQRDTGETLLSDVAVHWPSKGRVLTSGSFTIDIAEDLPIAHYRLRKPIDAAILRDVLSKASGALTS